MKFQKESSMMEKNEAKCNMEKDNNRDMEKRKEA